VPDNGKGEGRPVEVGSQKTVQRETEGVKKERGIRTDLLAKKLREVLFFDSDQMLCNGSRRSEHVGRLGEGREC